MLSAKDPGDSKGEAFRIENPERSLSEQTQLSNSRQLFRSLIGIMVGGFLFYLAAKGINFSEVWGLIRQSNIAWILPMLLLWLMTVGIRTLRWYEMLPRDRRPEKRAVFDAFVLGTMANNLLPGRLGDLVRAGLLARQPPPVGMSMVIGTIVLEKVLDGIVVLLLLGCLLCSASLPPWLGRLGLIGAIIFSAVLVGLLILTELANRWSEHKGQKATAQSGSGRLFLLARSILSRFATGLQVLRDWRVLSWVIALSGTVWLCEAVIVYCSFMAFHLTLPLAAALVTLVLVVIGTMLPAAPGFVGTYQFFVVTALGIYQVQPEQAFTLGIFLNAFAIVCTTAAGMVPLLSQGDRIRLANSKLS